MRNLIRIASMPVLMSWFCLCNLEAQSIIQPDDASTGILFGVSLDTDANMLLVGAPAGTSRLSAPGAAYIFDANTGNQIFKLEPQSQADISFGFSTGLSDTTALVGDPRPHNRACLGFNFLPDCAQLVNRAGAVYAFDVQSGNFQQRLIASEIRGGDEFGFAIDIQDDLAIIGSPAEGFHSGAVYLFDMSTGLELKFAAPDSGDDPVFRPLRPDDAFDGIDFGYDVGLSVSENRAVVGARGNKLIAGGDVAGAIYVFDIDSGEQIVFTDDANGGQRSKLQPDDSTPGDEFGFSVDVDGNLAVIGAPNGRTNPGSAYLFDITTGEQLLKLTPSESKNLDDFGISVAIHGDRAIVGAPGDRVAVGNVDSLAGVAYIFDISLSQFGLGVTHEVGQLTLPDPTFTCNLDFPTTCDDEFGTAVDVGPSHIFVGTPLSDLGMSENNEYDAGAVYIFDNDAETPCDFDNDGICDLNDLDGLLAALGTDMAQFDLNSSGIVDDSDIGEWLSSAAQEDGFSRPYHRGDTNLDGVVDAGDLNNLGVNWQTVDATSWEQGDFNGDRRINAVDLNSLGVNWQSDITAAAAVPEPTVPTLIQFSILSLLVLRQTRAQNCKTKR